jgi:DNA-binding MarR family transcriptional regulator
MNTNDQPDRIDHIIAQWRLALPELDPSPLEVVGRLLVLAQRLEERVTAALQQHELTLGQFDILATLCRHGSGLSPTALLKNVALSSGGMTARLDKLEEAGLLCRTPDPGDRRMIVIKLTPRGEQVIRVAVATRFAEAKACLPDFNNEESAVLTRLLRRWLRTTSETDPMK